MCDQRNGCRNSTYFFGCVAFRWAIPSSTVATGKAQDFTGHIHGLFGDIIRTTMLRCMVCGWGFSPPAFFALAFFRSTSSAVWVEDGVRKNVTWHTNCVHNTPPTQQSMLRFTQAHGADTTSVLGGASLLEWLETAPSAAAADVPLLVQKGVL